MESQTAKSASKKTAAAPATKSVRHVLTVNDGSSSIKLPDASFAIESASESDDVSRRVDAPDHAAAVNVLMQWVQERIDRDTLAAIGHRVVHGGKEIDFICE